MTTEPVKIDAASVRSHLEKLKIGDSILLSGTIYTARDAAHKKLCRMLEENQDLPFDLHNAVIYYAGPTPTKKNGQIGAIGPTTSSRMDAFAPILLKNGLAAMIGKGDRNAAIYEAITVFNGVYFCASGGLGALISKSIIECEEIAFAELGCESIKKLTVKDMPLTVAILPGGKSIFKR